MSGRNLIGRRLAKLEDVTRILSTTDKWALIERAALQLMSDPNMVSSFEDAFWMAMGDPAIRFTILEMDQLLAASDE